VVNGSPIGEMKISDKNQIFLKNYFKIPNFFLKKIDRIRENITTSFGDLFLTFFGQIPDFNPLELVELCQNHPQ